MLTVRGGNCVVYCLVQRQQLGIVHVLGRPLAEAVTQSLDDVHEGIGVFGPQVGVFSQTLNHLLDCCCYLEWAEDEGGGDD